MSTEKLLGVWRLESLTSDGQVVHTGQTHLVVDADRLFEVWPSNVYYDDRPGPEREYALAWVGEEGRLEVLAPSADQRSEWMTIRFFGDELHARIGPTPGRPAASFDDEDGLLAVYRREPDLEAAARLREPPPRRARVRRHHPVLGELTYDAKLMWWRGTARWGGVEDVRVSVSGDEQLEDEAFDRAAARLAATDDAALRAYAFEALGALYDETWRQDRPSLDAAGFAARMSPSSFGVELDGTVTVYYDDGDLFFGHAICVAVDAEDRPFDAELAG